MSEYKSDSKSQEAHLFNLTTENDILFYESGRPLTVNIVNPSFQKIFEKLVIEKRKLSIFPKYLAKTKYYSVSSPDVMIAKNELIGNHRDTELYPRLSYYCNQPGQKNKNRESPYLSLGLLKWKNIDQPSHYSKSPILLIPIEVSKKVQSSVFQIQWNKQEILSNFFLKEKLRQFKGLQYPEIRTLMSNKDFDNYFKKIQNITNKFQDWMILNEIFLDFFNFEELIEIKDPDLLIGHDDYSKEFPYTDRIKLVEYLEGQNWDEIHNWKPLIYVCRDIFISKIVWKRWKQEEQRRIKEKEQKKYRAIVHNKGRSYRPEIKKSVLVPEISIINKELREYLNNLLT